MHPSIRSARQSQLHCSIDFDVTSICLPPPSTLAVERPTIVSSPTTVFQHRASCMDLTRHGQSTYPDVRPRQDTPPSRRQISTDFSSQPGNSPLPQTQWSELPLPCHPRDSVALVEQPHAPPVPSTHDWRLRPSILGNALSASNRSRPSGRRRRPRKLLELPRADENGRPIDMSMLYPQMSPYDDEQTSPYSAPDALQHGRSCSQPNSPNFTQLHPPDPTHDPHAFQLPRSPTYPPAGRRRMHSASGIQDAAFADEQEFRLFVEATAGLGPESSSFRHTSPTALPSTSSPQRQWRMEHYAPSPVERTAVNWSALDEPLVSPLEETPTTLLAFQQLAQMPEATTLQPRRQTSASGLDSWLQSLIAAPPDSTPHDEVGEDELPDYASSQAQAQAAQRAEAARRAQELQRRWQASGGRRGC